jgi:hypothetical protein
MTTITTAKFNKVKNGIYKNFIIPRAKTLGIPPELIIEEINNVWEKRLQSRATNQFPTDFANKTYT